MDVLRRCKAWGDRYGWKKLSTLIGITIVNLPQGLSMYYGNLLTYITSYLKVRLGEDTASLSPTIYSSVAVCWAFGLLTAKKTGSCVPRFIKFGMGFVLMDISLACSFFLVQQSGLWTTVTLGALAGLASGQSRAVTYEYFLDWFSDKNTGLLDAIVSNTAPGAMLFNFLMTSYVNPDNLSPQLKVGELTYFQQDQVLDRVPSLLLMMAGCSFLCHSVGYMLVYDIHSVRKQSTVQKVKPERRRLLESESTEEEEGNSDFVCEYDQITGTDELHLTSHDARASRGESSTSVQHAQLNGTEKNSKHKDRERRIPRKINSETTTSSTFQKTNVSLNSSQIAARNSASMPENFDSGHRRSSGAHNKTIRDRSNDSFHDDNSNFPENGQELQDPLSSTDKSTTSQTAQPKQSLFQSVCSKEFAIIWFISGMALINLNTVGLAYKPLGQMYIKDDYFLLFIASATMVIFLPARMIWGVCFDTFTLKTSFVLTQSACTFFFSLWYFQPAVSPWLFLVGTCLCFASMSGPLALVPLGLYRLLGADNFTTLYGLASTAGLTFSLMFPYVVSYCLEHSTWFAVFIITAGLNFIALLLVLCFFPQNIERHRR